jgi:hypothetical protein
MLALAVAQDRVRVFVRRGRMGSVPSLPIVTLEVEPDGFRAVTVEMTPGQTRTLIGVLEAALVAELRDKGPTAHTFNSKEGHYVCQDCGRSFEDPIHVKALSQEKGT